MDLNLRLRVGGSRMPTARDSWTRAVPRALLSFLLSGTSSRGFICCRIGDVTCSYKRMLHIVLHRLLTLCCLHVHACDSCAFLLAPPPFSSGLPVVHFRAKICRGQVFWCTLTPCCLNVFFPTVSSSCPGACGPSKSVWKLVRCIQ